MATPVFLIAGSTTDLTDTCDVCDASTASFLPWSRFSFCSSSNSTADERSGVVPGKIIMPGGAWSIIAFVRSKVTTGVLCFLAMHVWIAASWAASLRFPITAKTLSSSVKWVHT